MALETISFFSDYGLTDESVGVTKSIIWSINPSVRIIDITHGVDAHDVRAGGLALARAVQFLMPGVVLGVVDPGVGSKRKGVCFELGGGQSYLVGPDNGLFAPAIGMIGGATAAWVLDNTDYHLPSMGATFDGRDIFAPVAAHLSAGVPASELGTPIDTTLLIPGVLPVAETDADGIIDAEVLWIDHFGNVQLNVDPDQTASWPGLRMEATNLNRTGIPVRTYSEITTGAVGVLTDASGLLSIAVDRGSAAGELGLHEGDRIKLQRTEIAGSSTTVTLGPTRENPNA